MFGYIPITGVDSFGGAEIESQLRDDLPAEAEIETSSKAVGSWNGVGVEHIVLISVNAVGPVLSIECLKTEFQAYWCMVYSVWCKVERNVLINRITIGYW